MGNFSSLPPELRLQILQALADGHDEVPPARCVIAAYASVCKSWRFFFEPLVFQSITLRRDDLPEFRQITKDPARSQLIKHVWLRLEEPSIQQRHDMGVYDSNWSKGFYTGMIWHLWTTLSGWSQVDEHPGLTLEFTSHRHIVEDAALPILRREDLRKYSKYLRTGSVEAYKDADKFFVGGGTDDEVMGSKFRRDVFCKGVRVDDAKPLPKVEVVTRFLTRRAYFRNLRPELMFLVFDSLPKVHHVRIERWRHGLVAPEGEWRQGMEKGLPYHVPTSLKTLSIFEEAGTKNPRFELLPTGKIAEAIILGTLHLENLSLCFFVDAEDFFQILLTTDVETRAYGDQPRLPNGGYKDLASLTLTSSRFSAKIDDDWDSSSWESGVKDLIQMAAAAAQKMPKLRLMEIWNGGDGTASVFRYENEEDNAPEITWLSTQSCAPAGDLSEDWFKVVSIHGRSALRILSPVILSGDFEYYGSVVPHLKSRRHVLHPVSAAQMK